MIDTRRASAEDLERASDVLADAFQDYAWTRWTVDPEDHQDRIKQLQFIFLRTLGYPLGLCWVSSMDDAIQCVAVWMPSEVHVPLHVLSELKVQEATLEGSRHSASQAAENRLREIRPTERYLLLGTIGTSVNYQRRGLGRHTLQPGLDFADGSNLLCYLETSSETNVAFYESLGFYVDQRIQIDELGPCVWTMRRRPMRC